MGKSNAVSPLALPTVAALTPSRYNVSIVDEEIEELVVEDHDPDIVGITAVIPNVKRAYEIADAFRKKGTTVVMGGAQVSFNIDESLRHCDAVVAGEAEGAWEGCLADFEAGNLGKVYRNADITAFTKSPVPRWDLVKTGKIMALGVQVSRGCPYQCDFCLVRNLFGKRQRYRDIDNVIEEIKGLPKRQITFVDDNLTAQKPYARELMKRLAPLKVSWMCQASLDVADDETLLREMAGAGCTSILIGFESVNPDSLHETHKFHNRIGKYEEAVRRIHAAGIHVVVSFIVGFEADRLDAFDRVLEFTMRNNISFIMLNVLTAYPGTDLYARMKEQGRMADFDPDLLNGIFPTMQYRNMSQTGLFHKYFETLEKMFDFDRVREKITSVLGTGAFTKFNEGEIGAREKMLSVLHLVRRCVITRDQGARRLFWALLSLVVSGRTKPGVAVEFMLFVLSFHGYLDYTRGHRNEILEKIRISDKGPLVPQ
jgi:radical SAM superfamily enzyme YgiQ (UPF0313 family)